MSAKNKLNWRDWRSVGRHVVWPLIGGAALAGLDAGVEVVAGGKIDPALILATSRTAIGIALLAGLGRLAQRFRLDLGDG